MEYDFQKNYTGEKIEFRISEEINGFYIEGKSFGTVEDCWTEDGVEHFQVNNPAQTCSRIVTEDQII